MRRLSAWLPTIMVLGVLLYLTLQSPEDTTFLSTSIRKWLMGYWPKGYVPEWIRNHHTFRSVAHIPLYFVLSLCAYTGWSSSGKRPGISAFISCSLVGLADEGLKSILPTREFDLGDWGFDLAGICIGILAILFCKYIYRKVRANHV